MTAKTPSIGPIPPLDPPVKAVIAPLKEIVETITGRRVARIERLQYGATDVAIIDKINEIIDRLQS